MAPTTERQRAAMFAQARRERVLPHVAQMARQSYEEEVRYLADEYRERILAGAFSGARPNGDGCRYQDLEDELARRHPWTRTFELAMFVIGISTWTRTYTDVCCVEISDARVTRLSAAECLAHDVLAEAARRGWVRMERGSYPVRRGPRSPSTAASRRAA